MKTVIVKLKWRLVRAVAADVVVIGVAVVGGDVVATVNYGDNTCTHTSARFTQTYIHTYSQGSPFACMSTAIVRARLCVFVCYFCFLLHTLRLRLIEDFWHFPDQRCCLCIIFFCSFLCVTVFFVVLVFAVATEQTINQSAVLTSNCVPQTIAVVSVCVCVCMCACS